MVRACGSARRVSGIVGFVGLVVSAAALAAPRIAPRPTPQTTPGPALSAASAEEGAVGRFSLTCPLTVRAYEIGSSGDSEPSAPAVGGDGFVVAFTHTTEDGSALYTQRISKDGALAAPRRIRSPTPRFRPHLVGDGDRLYAIVTDEGGPEAIPLDPNTGAPLGAPFSLPRWPEDAALGPRGLIYTISPDGIRSVGTVRTGADAERAFPPASLPGPTSWSVPAEQILASGPRADAILARYDDRAHLAIVDRRGARDPVALFPWGRGIWSEASLAAGPEGFAVARTGPGLGDLEIHLTDPEGAIVGSARSLPDRREPDARVRRYPRIASIGEGWAITYWDGTGPSLVRVDASGTATADPVAIRSGDECGGHTDARIAAHDDAIAVTWEVGPAAFNHGHPSEQPDRPGPRLAILRCADR